MTKREVPDFENYTPGEYVVVLLEDGYSIWSVAADGSVWDDSTEGPWVVPGLRHALDEITERHTVYLEELAAEPDPEIDLDDDGVWRLPGGNWNWKE